MAYLGRDEWEYAPRRPSPHRANRSSFYLNPDVGHGEGARLGRTRSQGAQPRPVINVYNDVYQDTHARTEQTVPGAFPAAPPPPPPAPAVAGYAPQYVPAYAAAAMPAYQPAYADDYRGRRMDQIADDVHALRLDRSHSRYRSRSRSHSNAHHRDTHSPPDEFYRYEFEKLEREKQWRAEQERIKSEAEVRRLKDDLKRRAHDDEEQAERRRYIAEYEQKMRDDAAREKERERQVTEKLEREKREKKDREDAEYERYVQRQKEKKDKEDAEYQKFLMRQKEEKAKKEKEEKEEKEKLEDAMRKKLLAKGFAANQIEAIISDQKKESTTTTTTTSMTVYQSDATPVFAKVHRNYLAVETLEYFRIPYKWDETDSNYIIILKEMDKRGTNVLFEHTKRLREGTLLIEESKKDNKEYAFYRKRDRSKSRNRGGEWKSFGILEYKK